MSIRIGRRRRHAHWLVLATTSVPVRVPKTLSPKTAQYCASCHPPGIIDNAQFPTAKPPEMPSSHISVLMSLSHCHAAFAVVAMDMTLRYALLPCVKYYVTI